MGFAVTFVVNAEIVLRQANVAVLVLGAPGARQRRLLLVHHRIKQLQPIHGLALPRIRFPRLHNTPFIAGGGHHCHPLPHSPRSGHRRAAIRDSWTRECRCATSHAQLSRSRQSPLSAPRGQHQCEAGDTMVPSTITYDTVGCRAHARCTVRSACCFWLRVPPARVACYTLCRSFR